MPSSDVSRWPRWRAGAEAGVLFAWIMLYIWWLRFRRPWSWMAILAVILISHAARGETPRRMGFRWGPANFRPFLAICLALCGVLLAAGLASGTVRNVPPLEALLSLAGYLVWGLFQQYLLNGYFVNRIREALPGRERAPLAAAVLFAAAHLPNWFLVAVTLAGGYACAKVYLRHRNLYVLGLAHGLVGFLLYLVVPDSISHHLYVGPKWFAM